MKTDVSAFRRMFGEDPFVDFDPSRIGINTLPAKNLYVGKPVMAFDLSLVRRIVNWSDELSTYEMGRLLPAILLTLFAESSEDRGDLISKLWLHVNPTDDAELTRAFISFLDEEGVTAFSTLVNDLIAICAYEDDEGDSLKPLLQLKANLYQLRVAFLGNSIAESRS